MPGSPYLEEKPSGILTWPLLIPILLGIFLTEFILGIWVWTTYPDWRFLVYIILGIDLITLIVVYVMTTRVSGENLE